MPLEVHVVTPEREIFSGEVQELIARGVDGEVGILGGHAPLLVRLAIAPLRLLGTDGAWTVAIVDGGFLHVSTEEGTTRADVLANGGELADDVDVEAARRRVEELQAQTIADDDDEAKAELARATARVNAIG